jgi:hypothetical protein
METEGNDLKASGERSRLDVIPSPNRPQFVDTVRPEGGNLDKIRDILFGPQARDYDRRLARLEERLVKEAVDLRADLKTRYDALELYIKKEVAALGERLKTEQNERTENGRKFAYDMQEMGERVEKKTAQLAEQASLNQRELREQILERFRTLSDDLRQKSTELSATLERHMQELRSEKTDRAALAALFAEVAMRLNNEWQFPGAEADL